jgi:hypothetical protein
MKHYFPLVVALVLASCQQGPGSDQAARDRTPASNDVNLYFISPSHGDSLSSPVRVQFGLFGMGVSPAGIDVAMTGHHHLLVDLESLPPLDKPIPSDEHHRHFGGGQTETTVDLAPGTHTLQLLLGDHTHVPHDPPVYSEKITVHVR